GDTAGTRPAPRGRRSICAGTADAAAWRPGWLPSDSSFVFWPTTKPNPPLTAGSGLQAPQRGLERRPGFVNPVVQRREGTAKLPRQLRQRPALDPVAAEGVQLQLPARVAGQERGEQVVELHPRDSGRAGRIRQGGVVRIDLNATPPLSPAEIKEMVP